MKISRDWLQKYFHAPLPSAEELADALTFHAFEIDGIEVRGDDHILDVKVTPNRGHDCLSYRGIAKEISAILNLPLASDPLAQAPDLKPVTDRVSVLIGDIDACARYIAGYIRGVNVGPSPAWLRERLEAMGGRSINNVVDATNFVMFNIGQPLHAFDAKKLADKDDAYAIEVRRAAEGEMIRTLDAKEYALDTAMLLITDKNTGEAIGIAGVKGGKAAEVDENTTDIIIESANFDGVSVRRTSRALNLRTDASQRYEQVISPELAAYGMRSVVDLILKIAGGELVGFADAYAKSHKNTTVPVTAAKAAQVLGLPVSDEDVRAVFTRLGFSATEKEGVFTVEPPFERMDLVIAEDLIEEIGRILGYDRVPAEELPSEDVPAKTSATQYWSERIREHLVSKGFSEVYTSVFSSEGERAVLNKVGGDRPFMRHAIGKGLEEALQRNDSIKEAAGLSDVRLFEIGTVWDKEREYIHLAIGVKGHKKSPKPAEVLKEMCDAFGAPAPNVNSTTVVEVDLGALIESLPVPETYESYAGSATERFVSFSRYPYIVRDIALWVPEGTAAEDVRTTISNAAGPLMLRIDQFDEFKKDGRVSYAFRMVFQSFEKTLTDDEVNAAMKNVYDVVQAKEWEVR